MLKSYKTMYNKGTKTTIVCMILNLNDRGELVLASGWVAEEQAELKQGHEK